MNHEQFAARQLERNDLEWDTVPVGAEEEDTVRFAWYRERGIDGVWTILDDVPSAFDVDAVAPRRSSETDCQLTVSFCRT